uniref:GATA-like transcription factor n=1 Tax=Parasteatoda tepidariorum TaxID=114398 RepID=A0A915V881_PARTP|nr:GATA-like transcription factor [Parasteatoda tepidariorum]
MFSPISDPDIPPLLPLPPPYTSQIIKSEPLSSYIDPRPYTPQVMDNIWMNQNDLDGYGCSDTSPTYYSMSPAEVIEPAEPTPAFSVSSDLLNYDYKPTLFRMDADLLTNSNKDEGYVSSPTASLPSLTPPSDLRQLQVLDSSNESGNSNDITGNYEIKEHHQFHPSSDSSAQPQPFRTQCVKCGCVMDIAQCQKEETGHYLCITCYVQSNQTLVPVQTPVEEPAPKRTRKKQSAIANARNQVCQNCECPNTTLWRRSFSGEAVCNACGLYEKLHKRKRPKSMGKDTIQTRRRKPRNAEAKKKSCSRSDFFSTST